MKKVPHHPQPYRGHLYFGGGFYPVRVAHGGRRGHFGGAYTLSVQDQLRGAGLGAIFTNVFRGVFPLLKGIFRVGKSVAKSKIGKSVLNRAKKTGLKAGINVVGDTLQGKNVLKAAKSRTKEAVGELSKGIAKTAAKALSSSSSPPKKKRGPRRNKKIVATPAGLVKRGKGKGGGGNKTGGGCSTKGAGVQKTIPPKGGGKRKKRKKDLLDG